MPHGQLPSSHLPSALPSKSESYAGDSNALEVSDGASAPSGVTGAATALPRTASSSSSLSKAQGGPASGNESLHTAGVSQAEHPAADGGMSRTQSAPSSVRGLQGDTAGRGSSISASTAVKKETSSSSSSSSSASAAADHSKPVSSNETPYKITMRCTALPREAIHRALDALHEADSKLAGLALDRINEAWSTMLRDIGPGRAAEALQAVDEHSYSALMKATALKHDVAAATSVLALCCLGCTVSTKDLSGYGPAHWAAVCAGPRTLEVLCAFGTDLTGGCQVGETALHRACRMGRGDSAVRLMQLGCPLQAINHEFMTPLDVAGYTDDGQLNQATRAGVRAVVLQAEPSARLAVFSHPDCLEHKTRENHQEAPERLTAILKRMREGRQLQQHEYTFTSSFPHASEEELCRVHSSRYVAFMQHMDTAVS